MRTIIEKVIFLQNIDIFQDVPSEDLAYLAAIAEELSVARGEVIYREHEPSDSMYLVLEGQVRMHQNDRTIDTKGPREAFGTWALFDEAPRVVTATTEADCQLLRIDREDFFDLLADHTRITQGIFKAVVQRLRKLMETVGESLATANER